MPRLTAPALESVLRTLYGDRLPPHVEMSTSQDFVADGLELRLIDRACDLFATVRIDRYALVTCGHDQRRLVDLLAHEVQGLLERLLSARAGAVRQALNEALGALADATEIVVGTGRSEDPDYGGTGEGRVLLRHREIGAAREGVLEPTPGGLPAWAEQITRLYRYQVEQRPVRAHLYDSEDTIADMLERMCTSGVYRDPSPLHHLEYHREVAGVLLEMGRGDRRLLERYIDDCGRLLGLADLREAFCEHEWADARWDEADGCYVETCHRCNGTSRVDHHHPSRDYTLVEPYGEVDLACHKCKVDAAKVPAVAAIFKAVAPSRYARDLEPLAKVITPRTRFIGKESRYSRDVLGEVA